MLFIAASQFGTMRDVYGVTRSCILHVYKAHNGVHSVGSPGRIKCVLTHSMVGKKTALALSNCPTPQHQTRLMCCAERQTLCVAGSIPQLAVHRCYWMVL